MKDAKRLSARLSVSPQILPEEMGAVADAGFRSVIGCRPNGEEPDQPAWDEVERAAKDAGLEARHIPVIPGAIGDEDAARFAAALDELPGPVLAFCRSGGRAAQLWALGKAGTLTPDEIINTAAEAGCDVSSLRDRLATKR